MNTGFALSAPFEISNYQLFSDWSQKICNEILMMKSAKNMPGRKKLC